MPTIKLFSRAHLLKANRIAAERDYNRQMSDRFIRSLPNHAMFPVIMTLVHEHAAGEKVDAHMRCWVSFYDGIKYFIDCDMRLYNSLPSFTLPDEEEEETK